MKKPKILIIVEGGIIQDVIANSKVDVLVLDYDIDGNDETVSLRLYPDKDSNEVEYEDCNAFYFPVDVDINIINHFFNQVPEEDNE